MHTISKITNSIAFYVYKVCSTKMLYNIFSIFGNIKTFKVFLKFEQMFRYYCNFFNNTQNINWTSFLSAQFAKVDADHILNCHNLYLKIIRRFVVV